jgi:putative transposase
MASKMTHTVRTELANAVRRRYRAATGKQKRRILDEFIASTGYHEKSAIRVLNAPAVVAVRQRRSRPTLAEDGRWIAGRGTARRCAALTIIADGGTAVADVCRQMGISEATFYVWKKKYANLGTSEIRELRQLREENAKLKRLVADLSLDKHILTEIVRKKV